MVDTNKAAGVAKGKWIEQDGPDHRKDRRVGADAKGEREEGRQRECWSLSQCARPVPQILSQFVEHTGQTVFVGWKV
jgi:hypothetical protein